MRSIQIRFDESIFKEIERVSTSLNVSYSEIVRDAVKQWLTTLETKKFEEDWIEKLKKQPDAAEDAEKWLSVQHWSDDESW